MDDDDEELRLIGGLISLMQPNEALDGAAWRRIAAYARSLCEQRECEANEAVRYGPPPPMPRKPARSKQWHILGRRRADSPQLGA